MTLRPTVPSTGAGATAPGSSYPPCSTDATGWHRAPRRLYGGPGDDQLGYYAKAGGPDKHEPGNDLLVGGTGNDRLIGGAGTDRMFGGPGLDQFFYLDTREEMIDWTPGEPTDYQPPIR